MSPLVSGHPGIPFSGRGLDTVRGTFYSLGSSSDPLFSRLQSHPLSSDVGSLPEPVAHVQSHLDGTEHDSMAVQSGYNLFLSVQLGVILLAS